MHSTDTVCPGCELPIKTRVNLPPAVHAAAQRETPLSVDALCSPCAVAMVDALVTGPPTTFDLVEAGVVRQLRAERTRRHTDWERRTHSAFIGGVAVGLLVAMFLWPLSALAADEADYVRHHCTGAVEYTLPDRTRVDCLTETRAIEFDRGRNWAQSVGQSLHYAAHTGRRAAVVMIVETVADERGWVRLQALVRHYNLPIDLRTVPVLEE